MLKTQGRTMFPELNMTGDTKAGFHFRIHEGGVIVTKTLLGYTIAKKVIEMSIRLEICSFMRKKRDKTSTTKNSKR